jgi:hypothetical protein
MAENEKVISNRVEYLDSLSAFLPALAGLDRADRMHSKATRTAHRRHF